MFMDNELANL